MNNTELNKQQHKYIHNEIPTHKRKTQRMNQNRKQKINKQHKELLTKHIKK